jgi:putative ATPase
VFPVDLFDYAQKKALEEEGPLAYRLRPDTIEEFAGQDHLVAPGQLLRTALMADNPFSAIFYGPPGTGKTTLAKIIARSSKGVFVQVDATSTGVGELRKVLQEARDRLKFYNQKTVLFIDEIHRFNKAQQDVLLPAVEQGIVILIGATTENPYFSVNSPLLSRTRVLSFYPLKPEDLNKVLERALSDPERGLGKLHRGRFLAHFCFDLHRGRFLAHFCFDLHRGRFLAHFCFCSCVIFRQHLFPRPTQKCGGRRPEAGGLSDQ